MGIPHECDDSIGLLDEGIVSISIFHGLHFENLLGSLVVEQMFDLRKIEPLALLLQRRAHQVEALSHTILHHQQRMRIERGG